MTQRHAGPAVPSVDGADVNESFFFVCYGSFFPFITFGDAPKNNHADFIKVYRWVRLADRRRPDDAAFLLKFGPAAPLPDSLAMRAGLVKGPCD